MSYTEILSASGVLGLWNKDKIAVDKMDRLINSEPNVIADQMSYGSLQTFPLMYTYLYWPDGCFLSLKFLGWHSIYPLYIIAFIYTHAFYRFLRLYFFYPFYKIILYDKATENTKAFYCKNHFNLLTSNNFFF